MALHLQEGQPCPVCGSLHHPTLAQLSTQVLTSGELEKLAQDVEKAKEAKEDTYHEVLLQNEQIQRIKTKIDVYKKQLLIDDELSKEMIIEMNKILKRNTSDEENPRYNVGGFKIVPNRIGLVNVINTTAPENVEKEIDKLLKDYNSKRNITLEDIIDFHYKFEKIHPFGDGNGRVGRMIMFKECLRNNIMPFIVFDNDKSYYLRGLKEYEKDKLLLIDTIKHEQDLYTKICEELLNFEIEDK